jgi:hypothetical protein
MVSGVSGEGVRDLLRLAWRQVLDARAEGSAAAEPVAWRP